MVKLILIILIMGGKNGLAELTPRRRDRTEFIIKKAAISNYSE